MLQRHLLGKQHCGKFLNCGSNSASLIVVLLPPESHLRLLL